nr:hypothetical protein [Tanacetum cinerariifolium]
LMNSHKLDLGARVAHSAEAYDDLPRSLGVLKAVLKAHKASSSLSVHEARFSPTVLSKILLSPRHPFDEGNANGLPPWQSKSTPCASLAKEIGQFIFGPVLLLDPGLHMPTNNIAPFCQLGKGGNGTWGVYKRGGVEMVEVVPTCRDGGDVMMARRWVDGGDDDGVVIVVAVEKGGDGGWEMEVTRKSLSGENIKRENVGAWARLMDVSTHLLRQYWDVSGPKSSY